jgi:hypothetical protein
MVQSTSSVATLRLVFLISVLAIIFASPALGAVTIGNVTNKTAGGIFTHTNNGNLLILIGMRRSTLSYNVTSASYNGVPLSAVPSCRRENSSGASIIAYYLVNPPQGGHTISTTGGSGTPLIRTAISVVGANTAAPFGSCVTSAGHSTNASVSLSSASGDLVLAATAKGYATETVSAASPQTQRWNVKSLGVSDDSPTTGIGSTEAGASSVAMSHSWSGTSRMWAMLGIPLRSTSSVSSPITQTPTSPAPSVPTSTGQTFFFSPDAPSTNSSCTDMAPCRLSLLPRKAIPGAQMILKNGVYRGSGTVLALDSTSNTVNGTSSSPITVRAQNPGRALLIGNGAAGEVVLLRVNWWILQDLRIENVNNSSYRGAEASPLICSQCNNVIIRSNIIRNPNAYGNNAGVTISGANNLIEDNDILRFHRNGLQLVGTGTRNNVVRGNYVGQTVNRLYSSPGAPNDGFVAYNAPNNIWENNIFEQSGSPGGSTASDGFVAWASGNKYYGNISIGATNNAMVLVSKGSTTIGANGYIVRDQVSIGMRQLGLYLRSPINTDVRGFTAHSSANRGLVLTDGDSVPLTSAIVRNAMLIDTTGASASSINILTLSHSQEWGSSSTWGPGTSGKTSSPPPPGDANPNFGACRVFVPDGSPYKRVGYSGQDVGATVLYAYVNGVPTSEKLWDDNLTGSSRGKIRFGPPVITGANDSGTGNVRDTVHQRLGFGNGSCVFPASY